jgi:NAD(P)H-flavin reductase
MSQCLRNARPKRSLSCNALENIFLTEEIFRVDFSWPGPAPEAGQFFMIRPERGSMFLSRPVSAARWKAPSPAGYSGRLESARRSESARHSESAQSEPVGTISFLVVLKGKGTRELSQIRAGDRAELTGPLGNAWADFPAGFSGGRKPAALVGGGIGIAPLLALAGELSGSAAGADAGQAEPCRFDFYAGFRESFGRESLLWESLAEEVSAARKTVLAFEGGPEGGTPDSTGTQGSVEASGRGVWAAAQRRPEGKRGNFVADSSSICRGRIPDFVNPADYSAVYACGPEPMLRTLAARCGAAAVPCYVSVEQRMACGVGACLGCTVETRGGNRRCCVDGPIFPAEEIYG